MSRAEQFIKDYTRSCSNELRAVEDRFGKKVISYHEWLTPEQARRAVEIEREELIGKACAFLEKYPHMFFGVLRSDMIEDFKNYMKGENE